MNREQYHKAFVLQFGSDNDPAADRFHGRVEHVATGRTASFLTADELLTFINELLVQSPEPTAGQFSPEADQEFRD